MKKRFRAAGLVATAATAAIVLAGCTNPGAEDTSSGPVEWPAQDTDLSGVSLTIWAAQSSASIPESVVAGFEELTGAEIDVVSIPDPYEQGVQTKVASGDKPDLAFWQPTASMLAAINAPTNLQVLDDAPFLGDYLPGLADMAGILDDTRYAALISTPTVQGVYYNTEVFAEHGVEIPTDWDEFLQVARDLKADGVTPLFDFAGGGSSWATQWFVQVQLAEAAQDGLWERVNANEETFTDPTIQGAIDQYAAAIEEGLFNADIKTATFEDQGAALLSGEAAMAVQIPALFTQLQSLADTEELNEKIGFFPISAEGNVGTFTPEQGNALVAFKTGDAQREAAARQLLVYWLGDGYADFVASQGTTSVLADVDSPDTVPDALLSVNEALTDAVGGMQALAIANPDLFINLGDMVQGTKTPEEVAQATQDQFAQLAKAMGAKGF
ncbi:ABC transporter substrate-binding protein [Microbacterium sp. GXF7504]